MHGSIGWPPVHQPCVYKLLRGDPSIVLARDPWHTIPPPPLLYHHHPSLIHTRVILTRRGPDVNRFQTLQTSVATSVLRNATLSFAVFPFEMISSRQSGPQLPGWGPLNRSSVIHQMVAGASRGCNMFR